MKQKITHSEWIQPVLFELVTLTCWNQAGPPPPPKWVYVLLCAAI